MPAQQRKDIETIQTRWSQRCRTIIQNLLHFSRFKEPTKETVEIVPLLEATLALVDYDINKPHITLVKKWPAERVFVEGDPNQLQQVFINLMTNAKQAMEKQSRGQLTIEVKPLNDVLQILIQDDGPGMPPEVVGKFRSVLHDQGTGSGHGAWLADLPWHFPRTARENSRRQRARAGSIFTIELPACHHFKRSRSWTLIFKEKNVRSS